MGPETSVQEQQQKPVDDAATIGASWSVPPPQSARVASQSVVNDEPLVDHAAWRAHEFALGSKQAHRVRLAWERMTEREKAGVLEFIELDLLFERLSVEEQEQAVAAVQEDRDFPTLRERLEAEAQASAAAEREAEAARHAESARHLKGRGDRPGERGVGR
jgi:hypothetical protein